jgi:hypothetical protein
MTAEELNEQTKDEWRELGFFYDYDKTNSFWRLVGSRQGLLKFCDILNEYAADERNAPLSEHEHYGPYWYLKLVTWDEAIITPHDIRGTVEDFRRLSQLTRQKLENASVGDIFIIDVEYSPNNESKILFEVKEDDFDAAKADPLL